MSLQPLAVAYGPTANVVAAERRTPVAGAVVQDCFDAVLALKQLHAPQQFDEAYARLAESVDALLQPGPNGAFDPQDARDVAYAIVALADEVAMKTSPTLAQYWSPRRLQLRFFNDNMAGEGFFQRLEALRHDPSRHRVLQIYYLALAMGFEGRYGRRSGSGEIMTLMASLHQTLTAKAALHTGALSAHGAPPELPQAELGWRKSPAVAASGLCAVALLVVCAMALSLRHATGQVMCAADALYLRMGE